MSEEFLIPVEGDDLGFSEEGAAPAAPEPLGDIPAEALPVQGLPGTEEARGQEAPLPTQTEQTAGGEPELAYLKRFMDEAGGIRTADLENHLTAAQQMIGRQGNELGQLRAKVRALEATREAGGQGAAGQQSQQQVQQQEQGPSFRLPQEHRGLLQQDDLNLLVNVMKQMIGSGVRGELTGLAQESQQYQSQQAQAGVEQRRDVLNSTLSTALEHAASMSPLYSQIPNQAVFDEVTSDPEISEIIRKYVEHADEQAFNPQVAQQIATTVYSRMAAKMQQQASAHLQQQSGPQFSPKVIPVSPQTQQQQGPQRTAEELEVLGSFA